MSIRRFPIVPAIVGVLVAAFLFALLPARRVPLSLIGMFAGNDVERIDVLGGLAVEIDIDSDDPSWIAETRRQIVTRLDVDGLGVAVSLTGNRGYVGIPLYTEADLPHVERLLGAAGALEFKVVHEDSDLMRLLAHETQYESAGPVEADVDVWIHDDSGRRFRDQFLVSEDRAALESLLAEFGPGPDHEFRLERLPGSSSQPPRWRSYYLYSNVELSGTSVQSAEVVFNPTTNRPEVLVTFDADGAQRFAELTSAIVGRKLAILLNGEVSSAPVVQAPIHGGRSTITMGGTDGQQVQRDAEALVAALMTGGLPVDVRVLGGTYVPPLVSPIAVTLARLALALFAGVLMFAAALLVQRQRATAQRAAPAVAVRGAGGSGARPWLRLAVTIGGPLLVLVGGRLMLPSINEVELLNMIGGVSDASEADLSQFSVFALGLVPILVGFVLVEIAALAVPRWRRLRHDPAGRVRLAVAAMIVGILVAAWQGFVLSTFYESIGRGPGFMFAEVVADPGVWFRLVTTVSLVAGSLVLVVVAALIGRYGLGNGFSILLAAALIPEARATWRYVGTIEPTPVELLALVGAAGVVVLATIWVLRARVRGVRLPAAGVIPIDWSAAGLLIVTWAVWLGVTVPFTWLDILQPTTPQFVAIFGALVVVAGVACSWLFSRTAPLHPATLVSVGYLVVLVGVYYGLIRFAPAAFFDVLTVVVATAVAMDVVVEWRARTRHGDLALVHNEHRVPVVDSVLAALADAGIPAHARGVAHRSLLHFFGPFVPVSIYVPRDRAADAERVLRGT